MVKSRCGWEGHNVNLRRKIDQQVFGRYNSAEVDAQTTSPAKVSTNIKNIKLLREAYHRH